MVNWSEHKVLVTGAAGFVGANLTRRLVKEGAEVHALLHPESDAWRLKGIEGRLFLHTADLLDEAYMEGFCRELSPTVIYHLATHGAYSSQTDTSRILLTNIMGTWNLLKALDPVNYQLFLNTGSSSEYGFKQKPMQEGDLLLPNSFYAVAKASGTMLCQYVSQSQARPIVTFRLFSVYGPYEQESRLVPTLIRRCLQGKNLEMASAEIARDFVFVEDVVDACLKLEHLRQCPGEIINIASGRQVSLKQITDLVLKLTGSKVDVLWKAMPNRIWDTSFWVGENHKARELLAWEAKTSLTDGLMQTIDWTKKN